MGILKFRKYARVEVHIPIDLVLEGEKANAYLNNLSEEGASLIADKSIPITTTMELNFNLPGMDVPVDVRADVLWTRPIYEDGESLFVHGMLFNRIQPEDREQLNQFIDNAMSY